MTDTLAAAGHEASCALAALVEQFLFDCFVAERKRSDVPIGFITP